MKVGLMRHFEVDIPWKKQMNSWEFREWMHEYDLAAVKPKNIEFFQNQWERCYCSTLPRAIQTAEYIFKGNITQTELIKEVPIQPVIETKMRMHFLFWIIFGRLAWQFSHKSQSEIASETQIRVKQFINEILLSESNVLVVSHGYMMNLIKNELKKQGFKGGKFIRAEHGRIYILQK